jgi:hypothetical protein
MGVLQMAFRLRIRSLSRTFLSISSTKKSGYYYASFRDQTDIPFNVILLIKCKPVLPLATEIVGKDIGIIFSNPFLNFQ